MRSIGTAVSVAAMCACSGLAAAQLRIANWNVTNYTGGRVAEFQTAIYGVVPATLALEGKRFAPDVILGEEFNTAAGVTAFVNLLNTAPGSPADWAAAPFIDGPDTDCGFFYRTSKVQYLGTVIISQATGSTALPPRHTYRYDFRLVGYGNTPATSFGSIATHMKAGSASTDQDRRLLEANKVRDNCNGIDTNGAGTALPAGWNYLIGGDFNIQSSSQAAYIRMVGSEADNDGRFWDPISSPGSWNNSGAYRFIHTQDPSTTGSGGMDDRYDIILLGNSFFNGAGVEYIGNKALTYSTTTWNDPNHSYRCWGNDGTSFNLSMTTSGNTMVGAAIAQALVTTTNAGSTSGGHLPVFLDVKVPAKVTSETVLNFGSVNVGDLAVQTLNVSNNGNVSLWTANGIADLNYSMSVTTGFSVPSGPFIDGPAVGGNAHTVTMDTSTAGPRSATLTITSEDPDQPSRLVTLFGEVLGASCPADFNNDGEVNFFDYLDFVDAFSANDPSGDFNQDSEINFFDYLDFVDAFSAGC